MALFWRDWIQPRFLVLPIFWTATAATRFEVGGSKNMYLYLLLFISGKRKVSLIIIDT